MGTVLWAVLAGCTSTTTPNKQAQDVQSKKVAQEFSYATKLGEAAVDCFLGHEYDSVYNSVFSTITPYVQKDMSNHVELAPDVNKSIETIYNRVLQMAAGLPKEGEAVQRNPWDGMSYIQMAKGYAEGTLQLPEDIIDVLVMYGYLTADLKLPPGFEMWKDGIEDGEAPYVSKDDSSKSEKVVAVGTELTEAILKNLFFPAGVAPKLDVVSDEFRKWYITTAQQAGILDKRLYETSKGIWCISADKFTPADGGKEVRVFDNIYTVSDEAILHTAYAIQTSSVYDVVREVYMLYDTGSYMAEYVTDKSLNADMTVRIRVTIQHIPLTGAEAYTGMDAYLEGVTGVTVAIIE